jgi:hypothetical protein
MGDCPSDLRAYRPAFLKAGRALRRRVSGYRARIAVCTDCKALRRTSSACPVSRAKRGLASKSIRTVSGPNLSTPESLFDPDVLGSD